MKPILTILQTPNSPDYYIIELDSYFRQRATIGPYTSYAEAKFALKKLKAERRAKEHTNRRRKAAISDVFHSNRLGRLQNITIFKDRIIQDWQKGIFVGPRYFHNISFKPNYLVLRDTNLNDPRTIPVAVWLGYYYSSSCRPGLIYHNERYLLFPSTTNDANRLYQAKEMRISLEYTLDITAEIHEGCTI